VPVAGEGSRDYPEGAWDCNGCCRHTNQNPSGAYSHIRAHRPPSATAAGEPSPAEPKEQPTSFRRRRQKGRRRLAAGSGLAPTGLDCCCESITQKPHQQIPHQQRQPPYQPEEATARLISGTRQERKQSCHESKCWKQGEKRGRRRLPGAPQASSTWQRDISGYHRQRDHEHGCTQPVFPSRQSSRSNLHRTLTIVVRQGGPSAPDLEHRRNPALACTTLVGRARFGHRLWPRITVPDGG
jgi:hypothetical protein